ncbi:MAG: FAD-binding oxidoreductase [Gammaproteobacteria bacterium]|nr:FAD-binding oxidoreductase [Gammaproteobacteria bacterium]
MSAGTEQIKDRVATEPFVTDQQVLIQRLRRVLGDEAVSTDLSAREAVSADVYSGGATCSAVIRPQDADALAHAVRLLTTGGVQVIARGGGLSYTGGYVPLSENSVVVDLSAMNRITDISVQDMTITVEAGVTWQQIHEALTPLGLRLPFFGTFSGRRATVGGGLSNGALFHGTARYGTAADSVLGLEVVLADGSRLVTGQAGFRNASRQYYRTCGPDLTGLFLHDAGALGIKVQATFRMIEAPAALGYASFAFTEVAAAARALAAIGRAGIAEDAYVFDPETTAKNLSATSTRQGLAMLKAVARAESGWLRGSVAAFRMALAGRGAVPEGAWSLHVSCAGNSMAAVRHDVQRCRTLALAEGGRQIADSVPRAVRAQPFPPLNGVLGPKGERWAALNAKVAHSDALAMIDAVEQVIAPYRARMETHGVTTTQLLIAISNHAFSVEPVLHWRDEWLPIHRSSPDDDHLATLEEPAADPATRALVADIRAALVAMFAEHGAASNQLGKTYPHLEMLRPETAALLRGIKRQLDPDGLVNPGVLGLPGKD